MTLMKEKRTDKMGVKIIYAIEEYGFKKYWIPGFIIIWFDQNLTDMLWVFSE